jgi:hypothetical protein
VRVRPNGQLQDAEPILIAASGSAPHDVASNGHGYFVVWTSGAGVAGAAVSLDGVVQSPVSLASGSVWNDSITVTSDGENYLAAWSSFHNNSFTDISTTEFSPAGVVLARTQVDTQPAWQYGPAAAWDGERYLLVWSYNDITPTDGGVIHGSVHRTMGLRLDRQGRALDPAPWVLATPDLISDSVQRAGVASGPPGECLLTYATFDADLGVTRLKARIVENGDLNPPVPPAAGDFNADGRIDSADLNLLLAKIRARSTDLIYDVNGDGTVTIADARFLVLHFQNP